MAVQNKNKDTRFGTKKGNKQQGKVANKTHKADNRTSITPNSELDRGIGSSYAHAVNIMREEADNLKGSQTGFLGEPKESIDVKQFAHSLVKEK